MNIKNIQQYRSFYKTEIRDQPTRDENFIGNFLFDKQTGKKKFGWFDIYHGDKDGYGKAEAGIENFLQSFLDMAKDGQAVYEFLQNAVDALSTHYTMIWGQDEIDSNYYLLVANNGKMFDFDSIRSILNVGSSTKTADSETIGKFGIGFKLAHRLVGKDNGLQELINENSGPILFSWKNYEIEKLANCEELIPSEIRFSSRTNGNFKIDDDNPWLFKILITCFPCLPENNLVVELPKMANGINAEKTPFAKSEYEALSRWVKRNQDILTRETYNNGTLFFIKLGHGKELELAEINLKEGVKFALAILKETAETTDKKERVLQTVQLNKEQPITYPELEYIKLSVDKTKEQDTYSYIRFGTETFENLLPEQKEKILNESNIEILFGFRKYNEIGDYFKGAPNLYLYFPLSEEVHNFNYVLHSNAFYKGSSRTFLHKGSGNEDGINERLFKIIVKKIDNELNRLSASSIKSDRTLFLNFYAALLTSGKSANQARDWIQYAYINGINQTLKKYIPVRKSMSSEHFTVESNPASVFIKSTKIDIDTEAWHLQNIKWFYWDFDDSPSLLNNAIEKFEIGTFSIFDLLERPGIQDHLNTCIGEDKSRVEFILDELKYFNREKHSIEKIRGQLAAIKILEFTNEDTYSILEFIEKEKEGFFLLHSTLSSVQDVLLKLNLKITKRNLTDFVEVYRPYFLQSTRHKGYTELTQLFSSIVEDQDILKIGRDEKYRLFNAFRTLNSESVIERIKELKIFNNNSGKPVCFKNLLLSSDKNWLKQFCIDANEYDNQLKQFLLEELKDVYQNIVYPFWEEIGEFIIAHLKESKITLDDLVNIYEQSGWPEKAKFPLSNSKKIIFQSEIITSDKIFFHPGLTGLDDQSFSKIQNVALSYFGVNIPDKYLLTYLDKPPFSFTSFTISTAIPNTEVSIENIDAILLFAKISDIDFFSDNCILEENGFYYIDSIIDKRQVATNPDVVKYIQRYYPDKYVVIPKALSSHRSEIQLSDSILIEHLIDLFAEGDDNTQELDLIQIVLPERFEDKNKLLKKLTYANLDATWVDQKENELYINLLKGVVEGNIKQEELIEIHKKISISHAEETINIGDIDSAQDSIELSRGDKKITLSQSKILDLENANTIKLIQSFHDEVRRRDLLPQNIADKLFKISNVGITPELVNRFLDCLQNKQICNAHQLLFVWLSDRISKNEFETFSLRSQNGEWYPLKGPWVLYSEENLKFIDVEYLINEQYDDLGLLLQLNDLEPFNYNEGEDDLCSAKFLFVKGLHADILESQAAINIRLDYLYKGWLHLSQQVRVQKTHENWQKYLSLSPSKFLLSGIQTKEEVLPIAFIEWYQSDKKKEEFFKAIGINTKDSLVEDLRKYLIGELAELKAEFDLTKINESLLLNTLKGLASEFVSYKKGIMLFEIGGQYPQVALISNIISHLLAMKCDPIPILVYHSPNTVKLVECERKAIRKIDSNILSLLKADGTNNLSALFTSQLIVYNEDVQLDQKTLNTIADLEYTKELLTENFLEHSEPFYKKWKSDNNIGLFALEKMIYLLTVNIEDKQIELGKISNKTFEVFQNEDASIEIFYEAKTSLETLKELLYHDYKRASEAIADLIISRNTMLGSIYETLNASGQSEIKSEHLIALEQAIEAGNLKKERKELIDKIVNENVDKQKYSYVWFESYLKFLLTYENKQSTTSQKTISFQEIKKYAVNGEISQKYFLLCGASSIVPLNIEDFDDFKVNLIIKGKQTEKINVEGVSKRGQDLLVYCREPVPTKVINMFMDVIQVKISFSPVIDLLDRLRKAFENRNNIVEWTQINEVLPALHFVYGPPGTGKTTRLCSMIIDEIKIKYNTKVLLLTPTNKAADVLCKKLVSPIQSSNVISDKLKSLNAQGKSVTVTRLGSPTDPELEVLEEDIYKDSIDLDRLDYTNILASTVHRIPYFEIADADEGMANKLFKVEDYWDFVIFDEASMISLPYIVFAILAIFRFNPNAKFIIAGDPKQIPPVVDVNDTDLEELEIQDENVYTMMNIKNFDPKNQLLRPGDSILNLDNQYRSVKRIGQLFSDLSYEGLLHHDRDLNKISARPLPNGFKEVINENVTFIDVPLNRENSIFRIDKLLYSSYHLYSAVFVAELVRYFDSFLGNGQSWTIGLIAPYKAQAILLNKLITSYGISDKLKIYSDTVHGFQGDECDIIFFISNPNNYKYTGHAKSLLSKEYIYNVAISRAKDYLIVLHPFESIPDNPFINSIGSSYSKHFEKMQIKKSLDIELKLFGQKDFIEKNSYITGHDNVNVFGQIEMKYFIKANENAIDIQLRKFDA